MRILKSVSTAALATAALTIMGSGVANASLLSFIETQTATINFSGALQQDENGDPYVPYTLTFNKFDPFLDNKPWANTLASVIFLYQVDSSNVVITITNTHD